MTEPSTAQRNPQAAATVHRHMNPRNQIDPSHTRSTFKPTYHTMHIVSAVSWNGSSFYWNVDRNRWDNGDNVIPSQAHEATEADLRIARQHAEDEGALHIADSAMLVNFDENADE